METTAQRRVPLIVVAAGEGTAAVVERLRAEGAVVYETRTPEGCLKVATAVGPDMIILPPDFPRRLLALLRQHPTSAAATIVCHQDDLANTNIAIEGVGYPGRHTAAQRVVAQNPVPLDFDLQTGGCVYE